MRIHKKGMESSVSGDKPPTQTRASTKWCACRLDVILSLYIVMITVSSVSSAEEGSPLKVKLDAARARGNFYQHSMKYSKPLNILLIGGAGAGKSSFINSAIRAITMRTGGWSTVGYGAYRGKMTSGLHRYNLYFPDLGNDLIRQEHTMDAPNGGPITTEQSPTIIDLCGLPDEDTPYMRMVLRLLFYGHLKLDDNILDVLKGANSKRPVDLLQEHPEGDRDLVIHRVVVVANADADVPWELLHAVMATAQPESQHGDDVVSKRAVPVFGLLTKLDLVEKPDGSLSEKALERKHDLIEALCLKGAGRFGMVKNYVVKKIYIFAPNIGCTNLKEDEEMLNNDPEVDDKILKFLCTVADPYQRITNDQWKLQRRDPNGLKEKFLRYWGFD